MTDDRKSKSGQSNPVAGQKEAAPEDPFHNVILFPRRREEGDQQEPPPPSAA